MVLAMLLGIAGRERTQITKDQRKWWGKLTYSTYFKRVLHSMNCFYCNMVYFFFQTDVGMVEFVGLIKVDIRRGTNLAVRDVMSSDPYVMLNLGHQVSSSC